VVPFSIFAAFCGETADVRCHFALVVSRAQIVDLANVLRQRLPKATLDAVRDKHGGLMAVLTRFPDVFVVHRERTAEAVALTTKFRESVCMPSPATSGQGRDTCDSYGSCNSGDAMMSVSPPESPEVTELTSCVGGFTLPVLGSAVEPSCRPVHSDIAHDSAYNTSPIGLASVSTSATPVSATSSVGGVVYRPPANTAFVPLVSDDGDRVSASYVPARWNGVSRGPGSHLESIHLPTVESHGYGRPPSGISPPSSGGDHAPFQNAYGPWNGISRPTEAMAASPPKPSATSDPSGILHYHPHATPVAVSSPLLSSMALGSMSSADLATKASIADASRCLHIGNVPLTMTEAELLDVLKTHGRVETIKYVLKLFPYPCLGWFRPCFAAVPWGCFVRSQLRWFVCRLVTQKGRRFAFCNFVTIDDAVNAKMSLSRSEMWRYNVSFAKVGVFPWVRAGASA
jgi:hypothetical protein